MEFLNRSEHHYNICADKLEVLCTSNQQNTGSNSNTFTFHFIGKFPLYSVNLVELSDYPPVSVSCVSRITHCTNVCSM